MNDSFGERTIFVNFVLSGMDRRSGPKKCPNCSNHVEYPKGQRKAP